MFGGKVTLLTTDTYYSYGFIGHIFDSVFILAKGGNYIVIIIVDVAKISIHKLA